ncbi:MAG: hypothetical protein ACKOZT_11160 [Cyanobium sp.]
MIRLPQSPRHGLLALLAAAASLLATQSLLWPRWPSAQPLNQQAIRSALEAAGFQAKPLPSLPAHRSFERSTSPGLGFTIGEGQSLRLTRGLVRERLTLQAATIANADPALRLQQRTLLNGPPPAALGTIAGAHTRQTCLVEGSKGGGYGISGEELLGLVERQPRSRSERLEALLGLRQPLNYGCVLISVSSRASEGAISEPRWQRLLIALQRSLERDPS